MVGMVIRGLPLAVLPLLAACSSMITGGELIRPGEPTAIIEISNASPEPFHAVLISECGASTYGLNRMATGETIEPGRMRQFTVSAGCWDVAVGTLGKGDVRRRFTLPPNSIQPYEVS